MKKSNLILIIIALILIVIISVKLINKNKVTTAGNNVQIEEQANKIAVVKKTAEYEIYNTNIVSQGGKTKIIADLKNISGSSIEEKYIEIVLLDQSGAELGRVKALVPTLKNGSVTKISAECLTEYSGIVDFRIE